MDNKRLLLAIAVSIGILLVFDLFGRSQRDPQRQAQQQAQVAPALPLPPGVASPAPLLPGATAPAPAAATPARPAAERRVIDSPRLAGNLNLRGARLDDLVLKDYRETTAAGSPLVRMFAPREEQAPYFAQWGWAAPDGRTRVPDNDTDWTATGGPLAPGRPLTLRWDNGAGVAFEIELSLDENFMVTAEQRATNAGGEVAQVRPWARIRRERTPQVAGYYILHEGFVGVVGGRLQEYTYPSARDAANGSRGPAFEATSPGGWAGFTDKYWLAALAPVDQSARVQTAFRHVAEPGLPTGPGGAAAGTQDRWQVDFTPAEPQTLAAGAAANFGTRLFAGAKEVKLLDAYAGALGIPDFDKAVDFGWFYFLTKPFFYALDWLFGIVGNFGVAILLFTVALKALFFPLASKAYKSMSRMKILAPKMQEIRERLKDDPAKAQSEMMGLYKSEKVNPASGCLPILIQIPVFFALYKVLFVTIEMRHAPFFGWIRDLSAPDPTNLFTLFGLVPWPAPEFLHMPAWAIIMGVTMWVQYKLNPQPPDPVQAKLFAFMPLIFTFMLASFPAGLVIYWSWNNLLSVAQQYYISRNDRAAAAAPAAAAKT